MPRGCLDFLLLLQPSFNLQHNHIYIQDIHLIWLPCKYTATPSNITLHNINNAPPSSTLHLRNSPPGLLNQRLAPSIRTGSRFTATIPSHDSQSFVTDTSQTWLTSPQSPRLPTPASNTISFSNQDSDFVLFPSAAVDNHAQAAQARRNSELAQATSRIAPNQHLGSTYKGQQFRQNSTQQSASSVSAIQNPRVSGIIQRSSSTSPSLQYSPIGQQTHFYANSAPSSTVGLHQGSPRSRPPVPLFHSTSEVPQSNMAHSDLFEGSSFVEELTQSSDLTSSPDSSDTMFNFGEFTSASDAHNDGLFDALHSFNSNFEAINDLALVQPSTVSPKDIMVDSMSAPPSGAFTDLTTPGTSTFESPYTAHSTETSPLFMDNLSPDDDPDKWPSLFGEIEEPEHHPPAPKPSHVAPTMSRNDSSPGQSSSRSSHQGRHSFTAGVAPRRRDKPLPAITVEDPSDTVAVKRARNTLAARKSREKRMERTEALVSQVGDLEAEVEHWKSIALGLGHRE